MTVEQQMRTALLNYGAIKSNWRITIDSVENIGYSDWAEVTVSIFKPRCRKALAKWVLLTNPVKGITDFGRSTYIWLK